MTERLDPLDIFGQFLRRSRLCRALGSGIVPGVGGGFFLGIGLGGGLRGFRAARTGGNFAGCRAEGSSAEAATPDDRDVLAAGFAAGFEAGFAAATGFADFAALRRALGCGIFVVSSEETVSGFSELTRSVRDCLLLLRVRLAITRFSP